RGDRRLRPAARSDHIQFFSARLTKLGQPLAKPEVHFRRPPRKMLGQKPPSPVEQTFFPAGFFPAAALAVVERLDRGFLESLQQQTFSAGRFFSHTSPPLSAVFEPA